jgi:tetratricopeptide (TPR) repeat protein
MVIINPLTGSHRPGGLFGKPPSSQTSPLASSFWLLNSGFWLLAQFRYNFIVSRTWLSVVILALSAFAQQAPDPAKKEPQKSQEVEPPEEDDSAKIAKKEYSFNPIQSGKEVQIGNYYFKKGSFKSAKNRFDEATKWDPGNAEAWMRLGDACEKLKEDKGAREAYAKYLEIAPDAKPAAAIRKKLTGKK